MTTRKDGTVLRQLSTLFNVGAIRELTDGQLLERFSTSRGEAAELAFEALVERHGPMVLRVCRAQLVDPHETQDAFQATFLILVQKARALWVRDSLGPWLHQVALRTASCAARRRPGDEDMNAARPRSGRASRTKPSGWARMWRRCSMTRSTASPNAIACRSCSATWKATRARRPARRIGRTVGTVKSWRFRGRERLRRRLTRLGLAPSVGVVAALVGDVTARGYLGQPQSKPLDSRLGFFHKG